MRRGLGSSGDDKVKTYFTHCGETGLHVNPKYPYLGASPNRLTKCTCRDEGSSVHIVYKMSHLPVHHICALH